MAAQGESAELRHDHAAEVQVNIDASEYFGDRWRKDFDTLTKAALSQPYVQQLVAALPGPAVEAVNLDAGEFQCTMEATLRSPYMQQFVASLPGRGSVNVDVVVAETASPEDPARASAQRRDRPRPNGTDQRAEALGPAATSTRPRPLLTPLESLQPHGRVPPHNLDAEKSLLGGILLEGAAFNDVCDVVSASDFYRDAHRKVFEAMAALYEDDLPIDRVTLKERLTELGTFKLVGGDEFVDDLDKIVPIAANLAHYAKIIREKAQARRLQEAGNSIARLGYEQHGDVAEFAAEAQRRISTATEEVEREGKPLFGIYRLDDFLALKCPAQQWLVPGLVPAHGVTVPFGPPGVGKTLLVFDVVAQAAAAGKRTLIVEEEGSLHDCKERIRRAAAAAGLDNATVRSRIELAWNTGVSLLESGACRYLVKWAKDAGADIIVLDSISALSGGIDENDSVEMAAVAEMLHSLKAETGRAIIPLGHPTKDSWKEGHKPSLADLRGHGTLGGRVDAALELLPLECPAGLVRFALYSVKQRDAEKAAPRAFEILMTGEAATVTSGPLNGITAPKLPSKSNQQLTEMMARVLEVAPVGEENAVSQNTIVGQIGKHKPTVLRAIKELTLLQEAEFHELSDRRVYRMKAKKPSDSGRYNRSDANETEVED